LFACFLIVGFLTLSIPRITPPGGLVGFDFLLMCGLPVGAYIAGKRWHNGPVFLLYGALGMLTFVPGYLADGRLGLKFAYGNSTVIGDVVAWTVGVLFVSIVCNLLGKAANQPAMPRDVTDPEL
jgi:hypothetical protein